MSIKEIKESMEKGTVFFGINQAIKHTKKLKSVFIARDARNETVEKLEKANIEFVVLKSKADITKELNLDFLCEVYSITKNTTKQKKSLKK